MDKPFQFKQFTIHQDRCAMKVGTDGVLLGAWADLQHQPQTLLDIGAGTGIIALMLAQRMGEWGQPVTIDAVEKDAAAYEQCVENFEASPWADQLFCYHASLEEFSGEVTEKYDSIISNPPFHSGKAHPGNLSRAVARQHFFLPFEELLDGVSSLLAPEGIFSVIIPLKEEEQFLVLASSLALFPKRITRVRGNSSTALKRSLLELQFGEVTPITDELTIENKRHVYTEAYRELTRDFYLRL